MKSLHLVFCLFLILLNGCNDSSKPARLQTASLDSRNSADNSPVRFKLVSSKFERCEKAPDSMAAKGFLKTFTFKTETEIELLGELTPDADCKERYKDEDLQVMQGRIVAAGLYDRKSTLEGTFHFSGDIPELAGTGSYKVSGMTLKLSSSADLSNPDIYIYVE